MNRANRIATLQSAIDIIDDAAVQLHATHTVRGKWQSDPRTLNIKSEWREYGRVIAALQKLIERENE